MFHLREGFFFDRLSDGSVRIAIYEKPANPETGVLVKELRVTPEEWASVVASMSAEGETSETWRAAVERQTGER